jgi:hypothetical protein
MSFSRPNLHGQGGPNMTEILEKIVEAKLAPMESRIMAKLNIMQQVKGFNPLTSTKIDFNVILLQKSRTFMNLPTFLE